MTFLVLVTLAVTVFGCLILIYRYRPIVSFLIATHVAAYYTFSGHLKISFGSINVFAWDVILMLAFFDLALRLYYGGQSVEKSARLLVMALIFYVFWLQFSEFSNFLINDTIKFDNLIRASIADLYPLIGLVIALSLNEKNFSYFIKYIAFIAVSVAVWLTYKEVFNIGGFVTSTGTLRRGTGETTVLLHLGLGIILFSKNLASWLRYGLVLLLLVGVALLGHRSAFLGTALLLTIYVIYLFRYRVDSYKAIFWVPILAAGMVSLIGFVSFSSLPAVQGFRDRLAATVDEQDQNRGDRLDKWSVAMKSLADTPLGGTKLNGLRDYYGKYALEADYNRFNIAERHGAYNYLLGNVDPWPPHNIFVNTVSRNGIIGLLLFLIIVLGAYISLKSKDPRTRFCGYAILAGNLLYLTFNNQYQADVATTWAICLISIPIRL
ncbi:O-antigen ligase family protein, partial [Beggiatoa alba]|nr:O-antigen ligase family protein [Beggiatoa alba]